MFDSLLHALLPLRLYGKTNTKEKKTLKTQTKTKQQLQQQHRILLLSLNVVNSATDNFCYLVAKI